MDRRSFFAGVSGAAIVGTADLGSALPQTSWSVLAEGKPEAVKRYLEGEISIVEKSLEHNVEEQDIAHAVFVAMLGAVNLAILTQIKAVRVSASGAAITGDGRTALHVSVEQVQGFVE